MSNKQEETLIPALDGPEGLEKPAEDDLTPVVVSQAAVRASQTMDPMVPQSEVDVLRSLFHLAETIKDTEFVPKGLRGSTPKVLSAILTGRELGVGPMTALRNIYVIEGKADFSAALQLALIRSAGHSVIGSADGDRAQVVGTRADNQDRLEVEWTMERAKQAGLSEKDNWKRHPESMLWARAVTELADRLFSDVLAGSSLLREPAELDER